MQENGIPNRFYRISIKGIIFNETRKKFAIILEDNGFWELPGGGLDWGESPETCLRRELQEEMGLIITYMSPNPLYFLTDTDGRGNQIANVVYEIKVRDLNFTPSDECTEIKFVSPSEVDSMNVFSNVKKLALLFKN